MREHIVLMEPKNGNAQLLTPVDLRKLGIKERQHLEHWIEDNPDILGSKLLILTTEFDRFDKSKKRLDILALDEDGRLVIIELKRDAAGTLADLQAIRYAAFCANMTFDEIVRLRATSAETTEDAARQEIRSFVDDPEFSTLNSKPRIILAAASFEDQELTSCVLWLRSFGVDISCVELACYPNKNYLLIAPRVIIPLPETSEFIVRTEQKQISESGLTRTEQKHLERTRQIISFFQKVMPDRTPAKPVPRNYLQIPSGYSGIHFEWWIHRDGGQRYLDVCVHFETASAERNRQLCECLRKRKAAIEAKTGKGLIFQPRWGRIWAAVYIRKSRSTWDDALLKWAAQKMAALVRAVQPLLDEFMEDQSEAKPSVQRRAATRN